MNRINKKAALYKRLNESGMFLLPGLEFPNKEYVDFGLENCYLFCPEIGKSNEKEIHLYLLFQPKTKEEKEEYEKQENFINDSILEIYELDDDYILLVVVFPDKFKKDFSLFMEGRYSEFTKEYKKLFEGVTEVIRKVSNQLVPFQDNSLAFKIINRIKSFKDLYKRSYNVELQDNEEWWKAWDMDKEILNLENFKIKLPKNDTTVRSEGKIS